MGTYLLSYHGGSTPETPDAQEAVMTAWMNWFGELGDSVVDMGNPTDAGVTVAADGSVSDGGGANPVTGYSIISADDLDAAVAKAKGCPVLASGGSVEVAPTIAVG
jgi:hypothetical protein